MSWKNLFDPKTGYIQGRFSNGLFFPLFGPSMQFGYTEGNTAQYTWMVPFDLGGLIDAMGGPAKAGPRLDTFLRQFTGWKDKPYLWIGNEPSFNQPWIYDWLGTPEKTQEAVSRIMSGAFSDQPGGLPGNDDLGATSAWYVWAALGLYPEVPGVGGFALTRPRFPAIELSLDNGNTLEITSTGSGTIQSVTLDGANWGSSWLPVSELGKNSHLVFNLGQSGSRWATGSAQLPPSLE
jgi:putative alpha-1,2-mannosidase